jgi:DNA-nicking Smr family endonuclease
MPSTPEELTISASWEICRNDPFMARTKKGRKVNKHGLTVLDGDEDLSILFGGEERQEAFVEIMEESLATGNFQAGVQEKKVAAARGRRVPIHERLRKFPGPQAEIDLHGCTAREAEQQLDSFVRTAFKKGLRTIRVITGKGLHSEGEAVLPGVVEGGLRSLKREKMVLACRWEGRCRMRSGSVLIYLNLPAERTHRGKE